MLPDDLPAIRCASRGLLAILGVILGSSCSTLPAPHQPAHMDHDFHASFVVGVDGRLQFPTTTRELVVRTIELLPRPAGEQFQDQQRWFLYPVGTTVHVHGQLRAYANAAGIIPELGELLPNARLHKDQPNRDHGSQ